LTDCYSPGGQLRALALAQVEGAVHERDVGESLWEVAQQASLSGVVLFGEQAEIVAHAQQAVEQLGGLVLSAS
jgi:hypothetical protein